MQRHGRPTVEPVLVLWGHASDKIADIPVRRHSGALVVPGKQLKEWTLRRGRGQLSDQQVVAIWSEIKRQVDKRDPVERDRQPMPRSLQELVLGGLGCLGAGLLGFMLAAQVLELTGSPLTWVRPASRCSGQQSWCGGALPGGAGRPAPSRPAR